MCVDTFLTGTQKRTENAARPLPVVVRRESGARPFNYRHRRLDTADAKITASGRRASRKSRRRRRAGVIYPFRTRRRRIQPLHEFSYTADYDTDNNLYTLQKNVAATFLSRNRRVMQKLIFRTRDAPNKL